MLSLHALVELVHALRAKGYDVGTQECLAASRLLLALDERGALPPHPAQWVRLLAPVFCSSRVEQEAFYRDYAAWVKQRAATGAPGAPGAAASSASLGAARTSEAAASSPAREPSPRRWPWKAVAALGIAALLSLAAWLMPWLVQQQGRITVTTPGPAQVTVTTTCDSCTVTRNDDGSFSLLYRRWRTPITVAAQAGGLCPDFAGIHADSPHPARLLIALQAEPCAAASTDAPKPRSAQLPTVTATQVATLPRLPHSGWQAAAAALPALLCVLALLALGWRTRLALSSAERALPPSLKDLRLAGSGFTLFDRATLRRIAQEFRRHRPRATTEIDATATVAATVARGGLFTPVLQQRKALPEYLVLIDQASARDHQARWAQELVGQLALGGVAVDRFFFNRDPRHVQTAFDKPSRTSAADLLAQHHDHVLLVFGSGEGFFDPLSNEPQPWLQGFAAWERRVLVTPLPQRRWGWREQALRGLGFVIAPADLGGMQMIASMAEVFRAPGAAPRSFPPLLAAGDTRWLERAAPEAGELNRLAGQLKWYLGPRGYAWLCALALYPQLQWDITLHLGQRLLADDAELRLRLADLIQLPWLRQGQLPQWLRLRLVADLAPEAEAQARKAYAQLLGGTGAAEGFLLQVASDQASLSRRARLRAAWQQWRTHAQGQDAARRSHPDSPLRDYAFVSFMRGDKPAQLEMEAPASWSRLFERGWLPQAQHAMAAALLAAVLGAGAWWGTGRLVTQPMEVVALHADPDGGGLFLRAAGQPSLWLGPTAQEATVGSAETLARDPSPLARLWAGTGAGEVLVTTTDGQWSARADAQGAIQVTPNLSAARVRGNVTAGGAVDARVFALSENGRHLLFARPGGVPTLASWSGDGTASLWVVPDGRSRIVHALSNDRLVLASADQRQLVVYRLLEGPGIPQVLEAVEVTAGIDAIALSPDGRVAFAERNGEIRLRYLNAVDDSTLLVGQAASPVRHLAFSRDGALLASAGDSGDVQLWDPFSRESIALTADPPPGRIVKLAVQADRLRVAAASEQGRLIVWSLTPPVVELKAGPPAPAASSASSASTPRPDAEPARMQLEVLYCPSRGDDAAARRIVAAASASKLVGSARLVSIAGSGGGGADLVIAGNELRHTAGARAVAQQLGGLLGKQGFGPLRASLVARPGRTAADVSACNAAATSAAPSAASTASSAAPALTPPASPARERIALVSLRTQSGAPLTLSAGSTQSPPLVVDLDVTVGQGPVVLEVTLHHSFATRGTCAAGGTELSKANFFLEADTRQSLNLSLPSPLPNVFTLPGFVGVSAALLPVTRAIRPAPLARAEQSSAACLPYQAAPASRSALDPGCQPGFVPRGAYGGDTVCVTPATRAQAQIDNSFAADRREPRGGAFGDNTCRQGFVWREARVGDVVCVTPEVRSQTAEDNRLAPTRLDPAANDNNRPPSKAN